MTWSKNCVLTDLTTTAADATADLPVVAIVAQTNATFAITDCKLYVAVVTLSSQNDNKPLVQLKPGFKRAIKWNKYRSEVI